MCGAPAWCTRSDANGLTKKGAAATPPFCFEM
jgi:hypothetical protein